LQSIKTGKYDGVKRRSILRAFICMPAGGAVGGQNTLSEGRNRIARHSHYDLSEDGNFLGGSSFCFDKRAADLKSDLRPFSSELYPQTRICSQSYGLTNTGLPRVTHDSKACFSRASLGVDRGSDNCLMLSRRSIRLVRHRYWPDGDVCLAGVGTAIRS